MAAAPMRSHSSPAALHAAPDYNLISQDFMTEFKSENVDGIPVHGIFHPEKGPMLLFYPEGKTYAIAIAVDKDIYFEWIDKFERPIDFNQRKVIMCQ